MAKKKRVALITGITGQDGSYLAELLLSKGYKVYGFIRRLSAPNYWRLRDILDKIELISGDMTDFTSIYKAVNDVKPDEIYNLAAMSFVQASWEQPALTADVNSKGVINILEAIRLTDKKIKFYQASSSEMYGKVQETPQKETTPFHPRSPYAISKMNAHWITLDYRTSYNIFACSGICFNHESPRRGLEFVTRKITYNIARIKHGLSKELKLGNLEAKRDWGFAGDYVEAMYLMLQQKKPDDFVIATGKTYKVREFMEEAFKYAGLDWRKYVKIDKSLFRKAEVDILIGDCSKAKRVLGWKPKVDMKGLVKMMVDSDMRWIDMKQDKDFAF
ncbi:MAG TPA: GDP-mannose 4,6-dehydratase [Firmicutes bacterium]|nr:GDP-mannose 4,6-dehydratase [Bacillota bacterium]